MENVLGVAAARQVVGRFREPLQDGPDRLRAADTLRDLVADIGHFEGVLIESGSPFFPANDRPCRFFRMAYSSISADRIPEGVARTAAAIGRSMKLA